MVIDLSFFVHVFIKPGNIKICIDEVTNENTIKAKLKKIIFFIIKYLSPVAIAIVFISGLIK